MKKITLIVLATLGLGAASVQADNIFTTGTPYLGGGIGYGNVLALAGGGLDDNGIDNDGFAYNFFGGYLVSATRNLQVGLEVGYTGYKDVTGSITGLFGVTVESSTLTTYEINILGVAKYSFNQSPFYLVGKAGVGIVNQSTDITILDNELSATETNTNAQIAGGIGYKLTSHVATDVTVNYTFGDNSSSASTLNNTSALVAVMANLTYSF